MRPIDNHRAQRIEIVAGVVFTCILVAFHLMLLFSRGPLWRDEISSLVLAAQPTLRDFWAGLSLDPFPAFFFLLLRFWRWMAGESDFSLRIFGCLVGLAGLAASWVSAYLTGRKTPLLSLLLLGACPTLLIWGDSLRAYGTGVFWVVLAFGMFWKVIERPRIGTVILTGVVAILSVHSIYTNSLLIFACGVAAAIVAARRRQGSRAALPLLIGGVAGLSLLPYVPVLRELSNWASLLRVDYPLGSSFAMMGNTLLGTHQVFLWIWVILAVAAAGTVLVVQGRSHFTDGAPELRDRALYAVIAAVVGLGATMTFFRVVGWGTNVWYYLPVLAVIAVAIDVILDFRSLNVWAPITRAGVALAGLAVTSPLLFDAADTRASNLDIIAARIAKNSTAGDYVIIYPFVDGVTFKRYFHGEADWTTIPTLKNLPVAHWQEMILPFSTPDVIRPIIDHIEQTLRSGHNVWVAATWRLEAPDSPPVVAPLDPAHPRPLGYLLRAWGEQFVYELRTHAKQMDAYAVPGDQPVSIYEHSHIARFSGWKDSATPTQPAPNREQ